MQNASDKQFSQTTSSLADQPNWPWYFLGIQSALIVAANCAICIYVFSLKLLQPLFQVVFKRSSTAVSVLSTCVSAIYGLASFSLNFTLYLKGSAHKLERFFHRACSQILSLTRPHHNTDPNRNGFSLSAFWYYFKSQCLEPLVVLASAVSMAALARTGWLTLFASLPARVRSFIPMNTFVSLGSMASFFSTIALFSSEEPSSQPEQEPPIKKKMDLSSILAWSLAFGASAAYAAFNIDPCIQFFSALGLSLLPSQLLTSLCVLGLLYSEISYNQAQVIEFFEKSPKALTQSVKSCSKKLALCLAVVLNAIGNGLMTVSDLDHFRAVTRILTATSVFNISAFTMSNATNLHTVDTNQPTPTVDGDYLPTDKQSRHHLKCACLAVSSTLTSIWLLWAPSLVLNTLGLCLLTGIVSLFTAYPRLAYPLTSFDVSVTAKSKKAYTLAPQNLVRQPFLLRSKTYLKHPQLGSQPRRSILK